MVYCIILCNVNTNLIHSHFFPHLTETTRSTQRFTLKAILAREAQRATPSARGSLQKSKVGVFRRSKSSCGCLLVVLVLHSSPTLSSEVCGSAVNLKKLEEWWWWWWWWWWWRRRRTRRRRRWWWWWWWWWQSWWWYCWLLKSCSTSWAVYLTICRVWYIPAGTGISDINCKDGKMIRNDTISMTVILIISLHVNTLNISGELAEWNVWNA